MKPIKFVLLATAALTVLFTFLAAYIKVPETPITFTLWQLRKLDCPHGTVILGSMVLPIVFGLVALTGRLKRWQAILSVLSYFSAVSMAFLVFTKTKTHFGSDGAWGAKLIVLALVVGLVASLVGAIKPEPAPARG
jgi:hypothetical protein